MKHEPLREALCVCLCLFLYLCFFLSAVLCSHPFLLFKNKPYRRERVLLLLRSPVSVCLPKRRRRRRTAKGREEFAFVDTRQSSEAQVKRYNSHPLTITHNEKSSDIHCCGGWQGGAGFTMHSSMSIELLCSAVVSFVSSSHITFA